MERPQNSPDDKTSLGLDRVARTGDRHVRSVSGLPIFLSRAGAFYGSAMGATGGHPRLRRVVSYVVCAAQHHSVPQKPSDRNGWLPNRRTVSVSNVRLWNLASYRRMGTPLVCSFLTFIRTAEHNRCSIDIVDLILYWWVIEVTAKKVRHNWYLEMWGAKATPHLQGVRGTSGFAGKSGWRR